MENVYNHYDRIWLGIKKGRRQAGKREDIHGRNEERLGRPKCCKDRQIKKKKKRPWEAKKNFVDQ